MNRGLVTAEEKANVRALFLAGKSDAEIAATMPGRTVNSVKNIRVRLGLRGRGGPLAKRHSYDERMRLAEPEGGEALRSRARQLARDLDSAGGSASPRLLQRQTGFAASGVPDLLSSCPAWFSGLWHRGELVTASLTDAGRRELIGGGA